MGIVAALLVAAAASPGSDVDSVILADGTALRGRIIECSAAQVRFVPASGPQELLLMRDAIKEVRRADGTACAPPAAPRPNRWATGVFSFAVLPVAGTVIGALVGRELCNSYDRSLCDFTGTLAGFVGGLALGTAVFVSTGEKGSSPSAAADAPRRGSRNAAVSFVVRF
jgi:hypothetical protein